MTWVGVVKAVGRLAALALLLVAMAGPWTLDIHHDQEESCSAPLVWLGDGRCACTPSLWTLIGVSLKWGKNGLFWLLLLPALPFLSTVFLLVLGGQHRWLWALHLTAWGLAFAFSMVAAIGFWSQYGAISLRLWGIWLGAAVAGAVLAGEILAARVSSGRAAGLAAGAN
jgi:hypothetical protein